MIAYECWMEWQPATKQEVLTAIEEDWVGIDLGLKVRLEGYLIDPEPASIERFRKKENAFIVAQLMQHVVFFDDIEEDFGTAKNVKGLLSEVAAHGNIAIALRELELLAPNVK